MQARRSGRGLERLHPPIFEGATVHKPRHEVRGWCWLRAVVVIRLLVVAGYDHCPCSALVRVDVGIGVAI